MGSRRNDTYLFLVGEMRVGEMRVGEMRRHRSSVGYQRPFGDSFFQAARGM